MDTLDEVRYALLNAQQQAAQANATAVQATAELRAVRELLERYAPGAADAARRGGTGIEALGAQSGRAIDTVDALSGSVDRAGAGVDHLARAADSASSNTMGLVEGVALGVGGLGAVALTGYLIFGGDRRR